VQAPDDFGSPNKKKICPFKQILVSLFRRFLSEMHWKLQLNKGRIFLSQKKLQKALKCFESAVTDCPVTSKTGLEKSLFFLGLTLKKLGRIDSALRCWQIGGKLESDGLSAHMMEKYSNCYGMSVNECNIREDEAAFLGIQLEKYLKMKKVKRFCSDAEKDVIKDIIINYWQNLLSEGVFTQFPVDDKLKFFRDQIIIFPFSDISYLENESYILFADFQEGKPLSMNDLCSCGSGIRFSHCCGRIKTAEELEIGDF
jgi:tetratricopeptide (TPR) repeat protein